MSRTDIYGAPTVPPNPSLLTSWGRSINLYCPRDARRWRKTFNKLSSEITISRWWWWWWSPSLSVTHSDHPFEFSVRKTVRPCIVVRRLAIYSFFFLQILCRTMWPVEYRKSWIVQQISWKCSTHCGWNKTLCRSLTMSASFCYSFCRPLVREEDSENADNASDLDFILVPY